MTSHTIAHRLKPYLYFFSFQSIAQIISIISGLIIVRLLDYDNYAIYAFAGALIGASGTSIDLGTGAAVLTFVPKQDSEQGRRRFLRAAEDMRRWFFFGTALCAIVIFVAARPEKASTGSAVVVLGLILAVMYMQARAVLFRSYLSAERRLTVINRADPFAALLRLGIVAALFIGVGNANASGPLVAWLLAAAVQALWLGSQCPRKSGPHDVETRRNIVKFMVPLLPGHAYFVLQSVLPMFSLSLLGLTHDIAELGALSRLGVVTAFFTPVIVNIVQPYLARSPSGTFASRSAMTLAAVLSVGAFLVISGALLPHLWLLVLGEKYAHLTEFVALALLVPAINLLSGAVYRAILASGETGFQFLAVLAGMAAQGVMLVFFPIGDLKSAYLFLLVTSGVTLVAQCALLGRAALRVSRRRSRPDADKASS